MYVLELACFRAQPQHAAALLRRGAPLVDALRRRFPGLSRLELSPVGPNRWIHLGYWDSREHAEAAANGMFELPEMWDWLAQVGEFAEAA